MTKKKVVIVIPARLASTRFPEKILADVLGKPLIQHVYERASRAKKVSGVYAAVDDESVYQTVQSFGGKAIMTSKEHPSGTDRIASAIENISADYIINLQADEPLIEPEHLDLIALELLKNEHEVVTLAEIKEDMQYLNDPNVVKVVCNNKGEALYFSRSGLPYYRFKAKHDYWYKHVGVYGYTRSFLIQFSNMPKTRLEIAESLEQLRILENGFSVKVIQVESDTIGVDTIQDIEKLRSRLWDATSLSQEE